MFEEELSMLREGPVFKEGSLPLARTWQHMKNYKYLNAHHNAYFSTFVGPGRGSGLCLENKMLRGLFHETKTTIMKEMRIYSA